MIEDIKKHWLSCITSGEMAAWALLYGDELLVVAQAAKDHIESCEDEAIMDGSLHRALSELYLSHTSSETLRFRKKR